MSERHGRIWWSELMTSKPEAACAYYGALCNWEWTSAPMDGHDYRVATLDGRPMAGVMDISALPDMAGSPPFWFTYIAVDDVDAAARATEERGGRVIRAPWEIDGVGRVAILEGPDGAAVGMLTPEPAPV